MIYKLYCILYNIFIFSVNQHVYIFSTYKFNFQETINDEYYSDN